MDSEVRCSTCVFYHHGYCKVNAPSRPSDHDNTDVSMDQGDWCGEHTVAVTTDIGTKYMRTFTR